MKSETLEASSSIILLNCYYETPDPYHHISDSKNFIHRYNHRQNDDNCLSSPRMICGLGENFEKELTPLEEPPLFDSQEYLKFQSLLPLELLETENLDDQLFVNSDETFIFESQTPSPIKFDSMTISQEPISLSLANKYCSMKTNITNLKKIIEFNENHSFSQIANGVALNPYDYQKEEQMEYSSSSSPPPSPPPVIHISKKIKTRNKKTLKTSLPKKLPSISKYPKISKTRLEPFNIYDLPTLQQMKSDPRYALRISNNYDEITVKNYSIKKKKVESCGDNSGNNDRYFSRLNLRELSVILRLSDYDISLTSNLENNILGILEHVCKFELGKQTWIRGTKIETREYYIDMLHNYTRRLYPEISKKELDIIIRRGSYYRMQHKLRSERRKNKSKLE